MRTMTVGGGTARERPASVPSMNTSARGGADRIVDGRDVQLRTSPRGSGTVHVVDKLNALPVRQHGGMQWTGRGFPIRIPTTWKVRAELLSRDVQHAMSLVTPRDVLAAMAIGTVLGVMWSLLG